LSLILSEGVSVDISRLVKRGAVSVALFCSTIGPCLATSEGRQIFDSSCVFCHKNGRNNLPFAAEKTLYIDALRSNGKQLFYRSRSA
jgi:cytochrome c5